MRVFTTVCLAGVLTAAAAHAGLPPVFQRYLKMFDGDYQRLSPEFSKAGVDQGTKDRYLQRLENHLKKVPKNYHSEADVKSRLDKVAALKGGGGAAPAAADAGGMSDPDRARKFQADSTTTCAPPGARPPGPTRSAWATSASAWPP